MEAEQVQREIIGALLLALPLRVAAGNLGLRQLAVPTLGGAFLCTVNPDQPLKAWTWLRKSNPTIGNQSIGRKWGRVIHAVQEVIAAALSVDRKSPGRAVMLGAAVGREVELAAVSNQLIEVLTPFEWLKEPSTGRSDPVGEVWAKAREQAGQRLAPIHQFVS